MVKTLQQANYDSVVQKRSNAKRKLRMRVQIARKKIIQQFLKKNQHLLKNKQNGESKGEEKIKMSRDEQKEPLKEFKPGNRNFSLSIVIPASIIDHAQSFELKAHLVSQIARAAAIFKVEEIVIIESRGVYNSSLAKMDPTLFFIRNLEYLETPPYLRKSLFPICPELKFSGLMNYLNTPHHFANDEWCQYREGVTINRPTQKGKGSWVNLGLKKDNLKSNSADCQVDLLLEVGTRVTVKLNDTNFTKDKFYTGTVVSPEEAAKATGKYWGYTVRKATTLKSIFDECPYEGGYDCVLGTSKHGKA